MLEMDCLQFLIRSNNEYSFLGNPMTFVHVSKGVCFCVYGIFTSLKQEVCFTFHYAPINSVRDRSNFVHNAASLFNRL